MNNQTVNELNNRNLDSCYFSIICFPTNIYFKSSEIDINQKTLYVFYGCNLNGVRKFITAVISDDFSKTSDWYNFFLKLKKRNLQTILYANVVNNKPMKDALSLAFPEVEIFINCFDTINKIFKYFTASYTTNVFSIVKNIYLSNDLNGYEAALSIFYEEFGSNQFLIDLLENDLKSIKKYYDFNILLRKHILCFYFCRDTIKKLSVFSHSKPYFSTVNEYIELMISLIQRNETKMYSSKSDWLNLLNFIYPIKKDLIKCYL